MTDAPWTTERRLHLARLWEDGLTAQQIADAMGVTRNAVLGVAHRAGLKKGMPQRARGKSFAAEPEARLPARPLVRRFSWERGA